MIRGANGAFHLKKDMTAHFIHQRFVALDKVIDRLAAYEDTGLTPEEVMELAQAKKDAINETQSRTEKNEPLTLGELRKMDEEPVWICPLSTEDDVEWEIAYGKWALVDIRYELCRTTKGGLAVFENYGKTWLAYHHKPKEGTT